MPRSRENRAWNRLKARLPLLVVPLLAASAPAETPTLTHPVQIWELPSSEKNEVHPIDFTGVITYYDPFYRLCWIELEEVGTYLQLGSPAPPMDFRQRVRLTGTIIPTEGLIADRVEVEVLENSVPLEPLRIDESLPISNLERLSSRLVTAEGYVDSQQYVDAEHWYVTTIIQGRPVICWMRTDHLSHVPDWTGNFIRVTGLYSGKVDPTQTKTVVELWVSRIDEDLEILGHIDDSPQFTELPETEIERIRTLSAGTRIRIRGRVQSHHPGSWMTIRGNSGEIRVETPQQERLPYNAPVEAIGEVSPRSNTVVLSSALVRHDRTAPPEPFADTAGQGAAPSPPVFNRVEQIRQLSVAEADDGYPVDISGVVVWALPGSAFFFLQDVSGGIRVHHDQAIMPTPPLGKYLRLQGHTQASGLAPSVRLESYTDLGAMSAPDAKEITLEEALTGREDGQWVRITGFLRRVVADGDWRWIHVTTPGGEFVAHIQTPVLFVASPGSLISVRGACDTIVDADGRVREVMLRVPFIHDIIVEEDAPTDYFDLPLRPLSSLRQLSAVRPLTRARVKGVVLHGTPGRGLTIQEGDDVIALQSRSRTEVSPGDVVEAVGILGREGVRYILREAVYRVTGHEAPPQPIVLENPAQLEAPIDSRLVRMEGELLDALDLEESVRLTLKTNRTLFEAVLPHSRRDDLPPLWPGAWLAVTGLYRIDFDDAGEMEGFRLEPRSVADLEILRPPRLWTVRRALTAAGLLGGLTLLGIAWVIALRRRVNRQTEQIRQQLGKEMALEERYRSIVENASDFIFTTDSQGRLHSINQAGERVTGYGADAIQGLHLRELLPSPQTENLLAEGRARDGLAVTFQSELRRADGSVQWVETSARWLFEEGRPVGLLGVARDITERKQIEEELKRARDAAETTTRAKSQFLANMSHEIRTPMNAIIGMSDLLLRTPLNPRQREFSDTIRHGAEALLAILNDILDFSKIEAGQLHLESIEFDLRQTVENTLDLVSTTANEKQLTIAALLPPEIPEALRGDPGRLRQILLNLLGNAIKFTDQGEVFLRVAPLEITENSATLRFTVRDTGIGIAPEQLQRLFLPFSQADASTTRRFGGTGLGLAITKQIVEAMGGRCGVESVAGEGSLFWCEIPFERAPRKTSAIPNRLGQIAPKRPIVVVSPSSAQTDVLMSYLGSFGATVVAARSTPAALDEIAARCRDSVTTPPLVVIDHSPPRLDAPDFFRQWDERFPDTLPRAILLSEIQREITDEDRVELGLLARVTKPVHYQSLVTAVEIAVRETRSSGGQAVTISNSTPPFARSEIQPPRNLRILVAEDNPVNQRVVSLQLQRFGHECEVVSNGEEVLARMRQTPFDVIFMDCQMPVLDGFAATAELRAEFSDRPVHIIALTASAMQGDRERCLASGMDDYLAKPIRAEELRAALARIPDPTA